MHIQNEFYDAIFKLRYRRNDCTICEQVRMSMDMRIFELGLKPQATSATMCAIRKPFA